MRTYRATGITLTVKKYRGTERLAVFYTHQHGKVEAIAKGVGKPASRLAPLVEPLTLSELFFARGRQIDYLTQGEVLDSFYELRRQVHRYAYASYLAELTAGATEPGLANSPLFDALRDSLTSMDRGEDPQVTTWSYCLRLLTGLGLAPALDGCVVCAKELAGTATYAAPAGGLVCADCQPASAPGYPVSAPTRGVLRSLLSLPIDRLARLRIQAQNRQQITALLRQHIAYHLGVRLKSEQFLAELQRVPPE